MSAAAIVTGPPLSEADWIGPLTLPAFLKEVARRHANRDAIIFYDPLDGRRRVCWSYAGLHEHARRFAKALIAAGCGKGTRVGLLLGNRPECVAGLFGAAYAGVTPVMLSTFSSRDELSYLIHHAEISFLVTQSKLARRTFPEELIALCPEAATGDAEIRSARFPYLRRIVVVGEQVGRGGIQPWQSFLDSGSGVTDELVDARADGLVPSDHGLIFYTSGTTSAPKGVLHLQRGPTIQFWQQARLYGRTPETRIWSAFPIFWTAGLVAVMGSTLAAGGCWVAQEMFDPGEALWLMEHERVTEPYGFPVHTAALAEHPDWLRTDLSSLRCLRGNYEFEHHPRAVNADPNWNMVKAYGLSETCAIVVGHPSTTPLEVQRESMGWPLHGNTVRIVDPETGRVLSIGQEGEICLKGPSMMESYVKQPREACFDEDGFLHTGDSGYIDERQRLHWTGRLSDMIKTGGANVSPAEIEARVAELGRLKVCRAVGVPDRRLGEMVVLCAVVKPGETVTEDEIRNFLRERLAAYKVPRRVVFFTDEELPLTPTGKLVVKELRRLAAEKLGAQGGGGTAAQGR